MALDTSAIVDLPPVESATPDASASDFMAVAMRRWRTVAEAESEVRKAMLADYKFRYSDQWDESIKAERKLDQRPILTINKIPQHIRMVTNQMRSNRPSVTVDPVDSQADIDTAEIFQGIVRHIERDSNADSAYAMAADHQVALGRGYWRLITEFIPGTFDERIRIMRVRNPFTVYVDPSGSEADKSDARYAFVVQDMPTEEYLVRFPHQSRSSISELESDGDIPMEWKPEGAVRVAEYFYVKTRTATLVLVQFPDQPEPVVMERTEFDETLDALLERDVDPAAWPHLLDEREEVVREVCWALINGQGVLDGNDDRTAGRRWPGTYIPIVQVIGDEAEIAGRVDYRGMVRDATQPQQMYNYWVTALTEMIALAPKAPYVGAQGQFKNHEQTWSTANTKSHAFLEYNAVTDDAGRALPPPRREQFDPAVQSLVIAIQQFDNDFKSVTGFFDASLGEMGPEQSGRAILARQQQGEIGSSHFQHNFATAIRYTGKLLIDLIPHVYNVQRIIRIIGEDNTSRRVMVGPESPAAALPPGIDKVYDLSAGTYDVVVKQGPSFETRRQESMNTLAELLTSNPALFSSFGDLFFENLDVPVAQKAAARAKKLLPATLQEDTDLNALPAQAQAVVGQLQGQLAQAQAALAEATQALETDKLKTDSAERLKRMELASKERLEYLDSQIQLVITSAKLESDQLQSAASEQTKRLDQILSLVQASAAANERKSEPPAAEATRA